MKKPGPQTSATVLQKEFRWLQACIRARIQSHFNQKEFEEIPPPSLDDQEGVYAQMVKRQPLTVEERLMLLLAMAPHFKPELLDVFLISNPQTNRPYSEFGGTKMEGFTGFLPTGETVMFLLTGGDLHKRMLLMPLFQEQHFFYKNQMLTYDFETQKKPFFARWLNVSPSYLFYLSTGQATMAKQSAGLISRKLTSPLDWEDLVLSPAVTEELERINTWVLHRETILKEWELEQNLKSGFRALFYGPSGTGKTLAATLIGKATGREVYQIDLSMLISKYIGETEKQLSRLFAKAATQDWILFFDEADALFGKRTNVSDSHDRYANQEVAYLLQRIESYSGILILATDHITKIKESFARRFQSIVHFPMPDAEQRLQLWQKAFSGKLELAADVDLKSIAQDYELAGGDIVNVLRYCSLLAMRRQSAVVSQSDLLSGIRREIGRGGS